MHLNRRDSAPNLNPAEVYDKAATLIRRDGFVHGDSGWLNRSGFGWCLEGALGEAQGQSALVRLSQHINKNEAYEYLLNHLNNSYRCGRYCSCRYHGDWSLLHVFSDSHGERDVLALLASAARAWRKENKPARQLSLVPDTVPAEWVEEHKRSKLGALVTTALSLWLF